MAADDGNNEAGHAWPPLVLAVSDAEVTSGIERCGMAIKPGVAELLMLAVRRSGMVWLNGRLIRADGTTVMRGEATPSPRDVIEGFRAVDDRLQAARAALQEAKGKGARKVAAKAEREANYALLSFVLERWREEAARTGSPLDAAQVARLSLELRAQEHRAAQHRHGQRIGTAAKRARWVGLQPAVDAYLASHPHETAEAAREAVAKQRENLSARTVARRTTVKKIRQ